MGEILPNSGWKTHQCLWGDDEESFVSNSLIEMHQRAPADLISPSIQTRWGEATRQGMHLCSVILPVFSGSHISSLTPPYHEQLALLPAIPQTCFCPQTWLLTASHLISTLAERVSLLGMGPGVETSSLHSHSFVGQGVSENLRFYFATFNGIQIIFFFPGATSLWPPISPRGLAKEFCCKFPRPGCELINSCKNHHSRQYIYQQIIYLMAGRFKAWLSFWYICHPIAAAAHSDDPGRLFGGWSRRTVILVVWGALSVLCLYST